MDSRVSGKGGNMVASDEDPLDANAAMDALRQCELLQSLIEISISSLKGLQTKCAASNDLTQHEIRALEVHVLLVSVDLRTPLCAAPLHDVTLESKCVPARVAIEPEQTPPDCVCECPLQVNLVKYIRKQLEWKRSVPESERPLGLDSYPNLTDWLCTINLRPEIIEAVPVKLSLDALLQMSSVQVEDTMKRLGSSREECSRITAALSCLKSATESGGGLRKEGIPWIAEPIQHSTSTDPLSCSLRAPQSYSSALAVPRSCVSVSSLPSSDFPTVIYTDCDGLTDPFSSPKQLNHCTPSLLSNPHATPPLQRYGKLMAPRTPPPPSRKLLNLLPSITLTRSKSQSQLANRIDDPTPKKNGKKSKPLLKVQVNGGGNAWNDLASRSPLLSARSPCVPPSSPGHLADPATVRNNVTALGSSPLVMRKDIGLDVTHRFSTKSWLSQTCQVCKKNMMFGVKCKHCKVKCHNRCTKEAPKCRISFAPFQGNIRRTESVPSGINIQVERPSESQQYGTLPKALNKKASTDHPPSLSQLDSSSNPSSTTSSTPSSPAPFGQSNPPSATPPPNPSPKAHPDSRFPFPEVSSSTHSDGGCNTGEAEHVDVTVSRPSSDQAEEDEDENQQMEDGQDPEASEDESEEDALDSSSDRKEIGFCKGRTLYSVVRDSKLDINKIRQIAQEIVKVRSSSFEIFESNNFKKRMNTRRENELKLPRGWIYYLAPEIVQKIGPGNQEDCLPFSKAADVYAFGTIWYELQAKAWPIINQLTEEILSACWSFTAEDRPSFIQLSDLLEKLPKLNRRLSHPGHFWKSEEYVS
ncbi:hypothetical protein DNTS_031165 [Danionella cerebrum]|uniref:Phorbol-ester/DAG-type domain-containing protein n=1 Tax=Danionella cerebrum TaxID=2873325 RepID=A0A553MLS5_9TELE|nr:hypothetical protein DNTS_031165 [Danionella translucida]